MSALDAVCILRAFLCGYIVQHMCAAHVSCRHSLNSHPVYDKNSVFFCADHCRWSCEHCVLFFLVWLWKLGNFFFLLIMYSFWLAYCCCWFRVYLFMYCATFGACRHSLCAPIIKHTSPGKLFPFCRIQYPNAGARIVNALCAKICSFVGSQCAM